RAESTLQRVVLAKRLLQRMQRAVTHQAFDRGDLGAVRLHGEHETGARRLAVDQHGAGTADAVLAPDVRAGEGQVLAEKIDEELAGLAPPLTRGAVDREADVDERRPAHGCRLRSIARFSARSVRTPARWRR